MIAKIVRFAAPVAIAAVILSGCGGGDDEEEPTAAPPTAETTQEEAEPPSAEAGSVTIGESFWHAGWKVDLGEAVFTPGDFGGSVTIKAEFENLSDGTSTFDSQTVLVAGGENYESGGDDEDLPEVPGGLTGRGALGFDVADDFSFDDAVLIIGNPSNNQAVIPIGAGATEELVTLEPQAVAVTGTVTAGALSVTLEGAEVRADLPDWSDELEKDTLAITIRFSATPRAGIQIGQGVLQSEAVALRLPDGTAVAVRSDGRSGVNELLQGREGTTIRDLSVRFEIPAPAAGEYVFILRGNYGPGGAEVSGELPFTIP
jgi:hypothetical protein